MTYHVLYRHAPKASTRWFGADCWGDDYANRKIAASDCGVLERAEKKDAELTTLVLAIYINRVLLVVVVILIVVVASLSKNAAGIM